jgi:hypothetical protein
MNGFSMTFTLDNYAMRQTFYRIPESGEYDEVFWREVKGDGEGYLLVWPTGQSHHTYRHPEQTFGPSDPDW